MISEPIPAWQERARDRSLATARRRADAQAARLVRSAQEMINEGLDVTVPGLVARAGMSTKTFYRHFSSRDDLLIAVMEDELAIGAHLVSKEVERHADPVERLRACVLAYVALPTRYQNTRIRQARVREGQRLVALHETRAAHTSAPLRALFLDSLNRLVAAGLVHLEEPELTARSLYHLLTGHLVDAAFDMAPDAYERIGCHAWQFTCAALGLPANAGTAGTAGATGCPRTPSS
jgi:TetR/AcrR family transcriptional regulator